MLMMMNSSGKPSLRVEALQRQVADIGLEEGGWGGGTGAEIILV